MPWLWYKQVTQL